MITAPLFLGVCLLAIAQEVATESTEIVLEPGVAEAWRIELLETGEGKKTAVRLNVGEGMQLSRTLAIGGSVATASIGGKEQSIPFPAIALNLVFEVQATAEPDSLAFTMTAADVKIGDPGDLNLVQQMAISVVATQHERMREFRAEWFRDGSSVSLAEATQQELSESPIGKALTMLPLLEIAPAFPREAVGVGARWRVRGKRNILNYTYAPGDVLYEYEVTKIAGEELEFHVRVELVAKDLPVEPKALDLPRAKAARFIEYYEEFEGTGRIRLKTGLLETLDGSGFAYSELAIGQGEKELRLMSSTGQATYKIRTWNRQE